VQVWDLQQAKPVPRVIGVHDDLVLSLAFSPDGQHLVTGSLDKAIRIWNLRQDGSSPKILRGHRGAVGSVAFSPNGKVLVSAGGWDGTTRFWPYPDILAQTETELVCRYVWRNLSIVEWSQFLQSAPYQKTCEAQPPATP
jgi:WD40 repeat protein